MLDVILDLTPAMVRGWFPLGLAISRSARERFDLGGLADRTAEREAALRAVAGKARVEDDGPTDGDVVAAAVLQSVLRYLIGHACTRRADGLEHWMDAFRDRAGDDADRALEAFAELYPPADARSDGPRALVELLLIDLAESNRAMDRLRDLFTAPELRSRVPVDRVVAAAEHVFTEGGGDGGAAKASLLDGLRAPMTAHPDDLGGQLDLLLARFGTTLPETLRTRLVHARDLLAEERRPRFGGPGPAQPITFAAAEDEVERFTPDRDWMTTVVLVAKLTHVWLDQLSKDYDRPITRLDQIPDAELDRFAEWGITGLWLIGLWQRSTASADVKQRMGNPEAIASAYALYDYAIADDLGGHAAYEDLRDRARARGIRLAADMVPNHVGIDGKWVIERPDWFLQLREAPYPNYRFTGPDLSPDSRVGVYLEDGYWNRSDAAVVFKRVDHTTGDARYIYHGNDGTQMPWNDTAQIDYLNPEAREAVIQAILEVARRFSVIRFDAAMTLARKHIRRLWHPAPGDAGAVPSRAKYGVDQPAFDAALPHEFWREVVDRVQAEVPDTLLLAEAFWLMEGYFVRSLGMHRVYNSAFMHMLKDEDNAGYRQTIANTLAFSPAVLQRFVNFMNNPDEETAVEQFGRGDKYFGVATLLVTLPGLPMIGHGQVQGFAEKYGMEYRRAYKDEVVDARLVAEHERLVFPLMRRRHLFSEADHFALYDFTTDDGAVNENVYAYSNRDGAERAVVIYNNAYGATRGRFSTSVPINTASGGQTALVTRTLAEALDLATDDTVYAYREHVSDRWFLRRGSAFADGVEAELNGYGLQVLLDFREMPASWGTLADALAGAGVPDLDAARRAGVLRPALDAAETWLRLVATGADADTAADAEAAFVEQAAAHGIELTPAGQGTAASEETPADDSPVDAKAASASDDAGPSAEDEPHDASIRLADTLRRFTADGRVDVRPAAIAATDAETVALAEALAEAGPVPVADPLGRWVETLRGPAVRAWLGVHAHEGVRWFRDERMTALLDAQVRWLAPPPVVVESLRAVIDGAKWRYDALIDPFGSSVQNGATVPDDG